MFRRISRVLFLAGLVSIILAGCGTEEWKDLSTGGSLSPIAPVAVFVVGPDDGATWTEFTFDASGSSDQDGSLSALRFRWDWESDGTPDTPWLDEPVTVQTFAAGTYEVELSVMDADNLMNETTRTINVTVGPLGLFTVTANVIAIDESFTFDAHDSEVGAGLDIATYEWDWGAGDGFILGDTVVVRQYPVYGNYNVRLRLTDSGGNVDIDTLRVAVVDRDGFVPPPMAPVLSDTFFMGSPGDMLGSELDESPVHEVFIPQGFDIGITEVTNQQFLELAQWALAYDPPLVSCNGVTLVNVPEEEGAPRIELLDLDDPDCEIAFTDGVFHLRDAGHGLNPDHPVKEVSWYGAASYCNWLTISLDPDDPDNLAYDDSDGWALYNGNPASIPEYRLPTEAEWEMACRADTDTLSAFYNGVITNLECSDPVLDPIAWYCGTSSGWTSEVAALAPNSLGLFDMSGNLWEWCTDWKQSDNYSDAAFIVNPWGPLTGSNKVIRGGYWNSPASDCRSGNRFNASPELTLDSVGFRIFNRH
ncbi:MAG: SUMF1/EgtB/PvdO family nonheme iron enzyme [bacterium]|nr:SUMF1/EgtB/PvdO family nonheme iron enzyme [bacterium]